MLPLILLVLARAQAPIVEPHSPSVASESRDSHWKTTAPTLELRRRTAEELTRAVDSASAASAEVGERLTLLLTAAGSAVDSLGTRSENAVRIKRALAAANDAQQTQSAKAAFASLKRELDRVSRDLAFTPLLESPRPVGFPAATVVGEIEVLDYPAYRMARAPLPPQKSGGDNNAFWKLFNHIKSHDIPMTAPVEMNWSAGEGRSTASGRGFESMAFLYVSTEVGRTGPDGEVVVLDVPAATVVSLGLRGSSSNQRVQAERERLHAWLTSQPERFEIVGPPRMMGWNSPMVSDAKRYWEVQFPVRILPDQEKRTQ
ncbi:MAG: heme-binding protein [Planctomycetota bacterium]|nr:heme-binding protein [Planctomycetota bacterium]